MEVNVGCATSGNYRDLGLSNLNCWWGVVEFVCCFISSSTISDETSSERGRGSSTTRELRVSISWPTVLYTDKKMLGIRTGDLSWKTTAFAGKLCVDFNGAGCTRPKCKFNHKFAQCGTIGHGAQKCGKGGKYKWTHT